MFRAISTLTSSKSVSTKLATIKLVSTLALSVALLAGTLSISSNAMAAGASTLSIENLYKDSAKLKGKKVSITGKVVKVNNNIMKRNFLHIQDGSGDMKTGTNDVTVTSDQTANIGDTVTVTGTVAVDTDFGFGYKYPLLIEKSTVKMNK